MKFGPILILSGLTVALGFIPTAHGSPAPDFDRDVRPILAGFCYECHGPDKAKGNLRLDEQPSALKPAKSGKTPIVPGEVDKSEVVRRIMSLDADDKMPPDKELSAAQVDVLRQWIGGGAKYAPHWAYRPVVRPQPPAIENAAWPKNDIDRFILAPLEEKGIAPSPEAPPHTLIKRLYYDLIGLPPSPEEVDAFVKDPSPAAYEALVDRLLASRHFGERWGRHWLDKARYADSDGYEKDGERPDAWRYRDWVISSINADLPFDQFTTHQLAGDLLDKPTYDQRLATAFHRQTLTNKEGGVDQEQFRVEAVFDRVETTGAVWLGLTVGCARCHNHKYDAISQREYYQLFAFYNDADEATMPAPGAEPATTRPAPATQIRVIAPRKDGRDTRILSRGDFLQPAEPVTPGFLSVTPAARSITPPARPTRLDLSNWLIDNPLTARVAANHLWIHLFGKGLVRTANDFGVRGDRPSHPLLLDYLADEYRRVGWSRKHMIRAIVTSAAYRQSSAHRPELIDLDPENRLLHRQNRVRVEAEIVRDLTLAAGGLLSAKVGGPSVFPPMPADVAALSYANNFKWRTSTGEDRYRRGMYTFFKRTAPHPNLTTFDCPDSNAATVERSVSNTPLQALTMLNNESFHEAAQALARRVLTTVAVDNDRARLTYAWRLALPRPPAGADLAPLLALLEKSRARSRASPEDATLLVGPHAAAGTPAAENAAWIAVTRILLNTDELITRD